MKTNKGFSFIELSIVLIIIGVIIGITTFANKQLARNREERGVDNYLYNINNKKETNER